jgi:CrcB protein
VGVSDDRPDPAAAATPGARDRPERPDGVLTTAAARHPHRSAALIGVVAAGGTLGTAARYGMSVLVVHRDWPWSTWTVNVVGAFALAVLMGWLALRGPDDGRRRVVRLLVGTGFLGGFTTYSALAVETQALLTAGRGGTALAYALSTAVAGLVASFAGLRLAAVAARRTTLEAAAPGRPVARGATAGEQR